MTGTAREMLSSLLVLSVVSCGGMDTEVDEPPQATIEGKADGPWLCTQFGIGCPTAPPPFDPCAGKLQGDSCIRCPPENLAVTSSHWRCFNPWITEYSELYGTCDANGACNPVGFFNVAGPCNGKTVYDKCMFPCSTTSWHIPGAHLCLDSAGVWQKIDGTCDFSGNCVP